MTIHFTTDEMIHFQGDEAALWGRHDEEPDGSLEEILWWQLLYCCGMLRGVVPYPPPWLAEATPAYGYVLNVDRERGHVTICA